MSESTEETFGAAMERLEGIVARLEGDETLGLEEALQLYQQGAALAGECRRRLAAAQLTLTELAVRPADAAAPPGTEDPADQDEPDDPRAPDGPDDPDDPDGEPNRDS